MSGDPLVDTDHAIDTSRFIRVDMGPVEVAMSPRTTGEPGTRGTRDPLLLRLMPGSIAAAYNKDPALRGLKGLEVVLYPGLWALWAHRLVHPLWRVGVPFVPRLVSQFMRLLTGVEIHPGATIGRRFFIDHGAGVVIGETSRIGDDVMMYHGVTLGGHGWWADPKGSKRHPTIGDNVTLGVGAAVLGPVTVGENSRIGPYAVVIDDVEADSIVVAPRGRSLATRRGGRRTGATGRHDEDDGMVRPAWLEDHEMGAL